MSKLYNVTLKFTAVVVADSEEQAHAIAYQERREIVGDTSKRDTTADDVREVRGVRDLPDGWDDNCYPYGTTDSVSIRGHLAAIAMSAAKEPGHG